MPTSKRVVPKFRNEAEEAKWWAENQTRLADDFEAAAEKGRLRRATAAGGGKRPAKNITIRIPVADLERARRLSTKKGLGYQTYMKMLLHEALDEAEQAEERIKRD